MIKEIRLSIKFLSWLKFVSNKYLKCYKLTSTNHTPKEISLCIILLTNFLYFTPLYSYDLSNNVWKKLNSSINLSNRNVLCMLEDSEGYYWFGTSNGLNKYDGYGVTSFHSNPKTSNYLSHSTIMDLVEDNSKNIWIGTANGLNKYNMKSGIIDQINLIENDRPIKLNKIRALFYTNNELWIASDSGLYLLNTTSGKAVSIHKESYVLDVVTKNGIAWYTNKNHLYRYDHSNNNKITYPLKSSIRVYQITQFNNFIMIATSNGLLIFDTDKGKIISELITDQSIITIKEDNSGIVYISSLEGNIYTYSLIDKSLSLAVPKQKLPFILDTENIINIYIDKKNILWVTGKGVGFTKIHTSLKILKFYGDAYLGGKIYNITVDKKGDLWLGTSQGISIISEANIKNHNKFKSIYFSNTGEDVWVVGHKKIYSYDREQQTFNNHLLTIPTLSSMSQKNVYDVLQLDKQHFLMATSLGLILWNKQTNNSKLISNNVGKHYNKNIFTILHSTGNKILAGSRQGLYSFNRETHKIKNIASTFKNSQINSTHVFVIASDLNEQWIGTLDGLFLIDKTSNITHYTKDDGLPDNAIRSIEITGNYIWIGTDNGLAAFNTKQGAFDKIHLNNDIFDNEFNQRASFKSKKGYLYFGSMEGLLYFNPKEFTNNPPAPETRITNFSLFNKPVTTDSEILSTHIDFTDHINLDYQQRMITFDFSSINFKKPDHLYAYQMLGLTSQNSDEWIITNSQNRKATFTPSPGEYIFRVKSGWDERSWSPHIKSIQVTITPPWWKSTWAFVSYVVLLVAIISILHILRTKSIRIRANELEHKVNERTVQLTKANKEVESLLERKNSLYENVSHELRTPITLILAPINELLKTHSDNHEERMLNSAKNNTRRLLLMVDQLLEISKLDSTNNHHYTTYSLSDSCHFIIANVAPLATEKNINLEHQIADSVTVRVTTNSIEGILFNIITNAIKYTPKQGTIKVLLNSDEKHATILIQDNGFGIEKSEQDKVFDKFFRSKNNTKYNVPGTGMGLAIVKEIVEINNGVISIDSQPGQGSTFIVKLPIYHNIKREQTIKQLSPHYQNEKEHLLAYISEANIAEKPNPLVHKKSKSNEYKLLIIEDTLEMSNYLTSLFSKHYHCDTALTGEQGIDKALANSPDLIICDIMLPGVNGFYVIEQVKKNILTRHIPVIILTAKGDKPSRLKGLLGQADDYISKPFDPDELLLRTHNILGTRKQLKDYYYQKLTQSHWISVQTKDTLPEGDINFLDALKQYVDQHYLDVNFHVDKMAESFNMSTRTLQKKVKSLTGHTPTSLLKDIRLNKAAEYLRSTDLSLKTIAHKLLFADAAHFSREFKQKFNITPSDYRNSQTVRL